jgi:hypothetical protein
MPNRRWCLMPRPMRSDPPRKPWLPTSLRHADQSPSRSIERWSQTTKNPSTIIGGRPFSCSTRGKDQCMILLLNASGKKLHGIRVEMKTAQNLF